MPRKSTTRTTNNAAAKKAPRMSASAARADGAAKTKRALSEAKESVDANLKAIAAADQENATKRDERAASADGMATSERAMAATGPSGKRGKTPGAKTPAAKKPAPDRKPSGLDLAAKVVAAATEPLNAKAITERVLAAGWTTSGKTPEATLYAAIVREIQKKGEAARFRKTDRGLFTIREGSSPSQHVLSD